MNISRVSLGVLPDTHLGGARVAYDFAPSRAGEHARAFLKDWSGKLVCDDYSGYKASFGAGVTEIGCMAHARRKFYDLDAKPPKPVGRTGVVLHRYALQGRARGSSDGVR